ncbi:hypothetical protein TNCV_2733661 [Trichonephila clavipes]|nr:hypothetical protein TNCV_2733661 [Trichonephila clavipes]
MSIWDIDSLVKIMWIMPEVNVAKSEVASAKSELKLLRFDIFELQETKLLVRRINTTNIWRLVQRRDTTPLRVKGNIEDVSSELDSGDKGCASWFKRRGFYCSRPVQSEGQGCGCSVVKVSDHGRHVLSSSPVPLKTHRVGQRSTLNLSRAEKSSRWCGS